MLLEAARKNASAACLALQTQNFASASGRYAVPKFTNRLSWALHMSQNPRTYTAKYISEKTRISDLI